MKRRTVLAAIGASALAPMASACPYRLVGERRPALLSDEVRECFDYASFVFLGEVVRIGPSHSLMAPKKEAAILHPLTIYKGSERDPEVPIFMTPNSFSCVAVPPHALGDRRVYFASLTDTGLYLFSLIVPLSAKGRDAARVAQDGVRVLAQLAQLKAALPDRRR